MKTSSGWDRFAHGKLRVRRWMVEWDFADVQNPEPGVRILWGYVPGGLTDAGQVAYRAPLDALWAEAKARHVSKRARMRAYTGGSYGVVYFARPFTREDVQAFGARCRALFETEGMAIRWRDDGFQDEWRVRHAGGGCELLC